MSRFAIDLSFYALTGLTQWLIQSLIIEKMADPFRNFMDLCSIANISVLVMTHPLRGFYIHGRSVHGYADADMFELNNFLQKEKENLCSLRGLENGSEIQTFIINIPINFRDRVKRILEGSKSGGVNFRAASNDGKVTSKVEADARVHDELNQFLRDFINHVDPTCEYVVQDAHLIEQIIGMEFSDTTKVGMFIR